MKSNNPKTDSEIWSLLQHLLKERCLSLTIKNGDSTIICKLKGNELITECYENGSLRKVGLCVANSSAELIQALNEIGVCFWILLRKLAVLKFWKRKTLYLEYLPQTDEQHHS